MMGVDHVIERLHRLGGGRDLLYREEDIGVDLLVQAELARLAEGSSAARKVTVEGFLACVDEHVFFQVLTESETLEADYASVLLHCHVSGHVSPEGKTCRVGLVASRFRARVLHVGGEIVCNGWRSLF